MQQKEIFISQAEKLIKKTEKKWSNFEIAINKVVAHIQTKYPNIEAQYMSSDGGIIFIDDSTMAEYYGVEDLVERYKK